MILVLLLLSCFSYSKTIVAVIDTGMDLRHPALKKSLWVNPGETGRDSEGRDKKSNGLDDDKNGFIDDVHGWNFAGQNSDLSDDHGHGTHIAGLISANSKEFSGLAPGTQLMILKYFDSKAPIGGNLMNSVRAIRYASAMGAHIINFSGGGLDPNPEEERALREAHAKNLLVVAAAGNERSNTDALGFYPASYALPNILSVGAIGKNQKRLPSSNWGPHSIRISAPGEALLSTFPDGKLAQMTGTSQATAVVTALAVLLREQRAELRTPEKLIKALIQTSEFSAGLMGEFKNPGQVSLSRALQMRDSEFMESEKFLSTYRAQN